MTARSNPREEPGMRSCVQQHRTALSSSLRLDQITHYTLETPCIYGSEIQNDFLKYTGKNRVVAKLQLSGLLIKQAIFCSARFTTDFWEGIFSSNTLSWSFKGKKYWYFVKQNILLSKKQLRQNDWIKQQMRVMKKQSSSSIQTETWFQMQYVNLVCCRTN